MDTPNEFIMLPALKAQPGPNGGFMVTQKYLDGAAAYAEHWPGPVTHIVELKSTQSTNMDVVEAPPSFGTSRFEWRPKTAKALEERLSGAALVNAFLLRQERPTVDLCKKLGVPLVYITEYSAKTERQILRAKETNPLLRWRRHLWLARTEQIRIAAVRRADGLQCSGTPTYNSYRKYNDNTMVFFDNRVPEAQVLTEAQVTAKTAGLQAGKPLRLAFGGRLIAIKGVIDLPPFALSLRDRNIPFTLDIYGSGPLEGALQQDITAKGLGDQVTLKGALDFKTGWIPALQQDVDLFVCCHPQGDPSSTYPEVMSCGVPLVGYDNDAWAGVAALSNGGWSVPMHDTKALVDVVARLDGDRAALAQAAQRARTFAAEHAFERTMARRLHHLIAASRLPAALKQERVSDSPQMDTPLT